MKLYRQRDYQSGIYLIRNKVNNKIYIGKAKNIYERIRQHINLLNKKSKDENIHLINSNGPSTKQISFAKNIAKKLKVELPNEILEDKKLLKDWIDKHNKSAASASGLKKKKLQ